MDSPASGFGSQNGWQPDPGFASVRTPAYRFRTAPHVHARAALRIAACLAPELRWFYQWVLQRAGDAIGTRIELVDGGDDYGSEWHRHDGAFICSLAFVEAADADWPGGTTFEPLVAPVPRDERAAGRPVYFSEVLVRRDAPWSSFDELRGCRWSFNEPLSQSGYGITRYHLLRLGETDGFFGEVLGAGAHGRSIEWLLTGRVDASAIDSHLWAVLRRAQPELAARLKSIDVLGPSPIQPLVLADHVPVTTRRALQRALVALTDDPASAEPFAAAHVERWVPVADATYAAVRQMRDRCRAAGFVTLR